MKTYKVYEIYNLYGSIEDVGETSRTPEVRLWEKTHPRKGKFYGRTDLFIHVIAEFDNRKEARNLEGILKKQYGLEWSERNGDIAGGVAAQQIIRICPHCGIEMKGTPYFRYHGDKCKFLSK